MIRNIRLFLALGALSVLAMVFVACGGNSVPGNAVARVGDQSITRGNFDHWLQVAAASQAQSTGETQVPRPPDFKQCIASKRQALPKPAKGQPKTSDADLKSQCRQEYDSLREQVLDFLISAHWIQGEAAERGIKVSDAQVHQRFQQQKKQTFQKESDYQKFLRQSGMTQQDLLFRVRLDTLSAKLRDKVLANKGKVTKAEVASYYKKHKSQFAQPESRDLRIVVASSRAKAEQAKRALQAGQSWKKVAQTYSTDPATKGQGGVLSNVTQQGQLEPALSKAVFQAPKGKLEGPVKTQFGWSIFAVENVSPATQQSLAEATPTIRQLLTSQQQRTALTDFVKSFRSEWTDKTHCRDGFVVQDCKNAPKKKGATNTTTTS